MERKREMIQPEKNWGEQDQLKETSPFDNRRNAERYVLAYSKAEKNMFEPEPRL